MNRTRAKRSFTLSPEALGILARFQKEAHAASLSAALEKLIQNHQAQLQVAALDAQMTSYYDSLSPEEVREQAEWGDFATSQLRLNNQ